MSTKPKENLDATLRQSAFPADIDVSELRRLLRELTGRRAFHHRVPAHTPGS